MTLSNQYDDISDKLIDIIVDSSTKNSERNRAASELFNRHNDWVYRQISKKIFNRDDIDDICQAVWMSVLQSEKLGNGYTERVGKFRAYLRAPIRWFILKHIDKLPFSIDEAGNKVALRSFENVELMQEQGIEINMLTNVIETIIKPALKGIEIKSRNVYVLNEYPVIFERTPELSEVANINAIEISRAGRLWASSMDKLPADCSSEELSIYIPLEYQNFIDDEEPKNPSGRYLAGKIGVTEAVYRKRLHTARKIVVEIVRERLPALTGE